MDFDFYPFLVDVMIYYIEAQGPDFFRELSMCPHFLTEKIHESSYHFLKCSHFHRALLAEHID